MKNMKLSHTHQPCHSHAGIQLGFFLAGNVCDHALGLYVCKAWSLPLRYGSLQSLPLYSLVKRQTLHLKLEGWDYYTDKEAEIGQASGGQNDHV